MHPLGPLHTRHFHTQYCDKRYCDKKDNFEPWMSKGQGKLLMKISSRNITFFLSLPWFLKAYLGWHRNM